MKFVKIEPPGSFCTYEALRDALKVRGGSTFLDVGCGAGMISKLLCEEGLTGVGIDFSERALAIAKENLATEIRSGKYRLQADDIHDLPADFAKVDLAVSYMVMEHVEDDVGFIKAISRYVKPGGVIILGVPGRRDKWSIEDDTVGHLRRYDRADLDDVMRKAGLLQRDVWSVAVLVANILLHIGAWLISKSGEVSKVGLSQREQTETSGIRDIPWKTVFPPWVKIILNRTTLWPLFIVQRLFYRTGLGVTMMGAGELPRS
ncbi:class I SAM-dependent methyltransferase [Tardiphaga sp. vice304]|uniref:class I SAM-dependent methyltransferase n=1 Tax=Tardiphaga sp. vice304 TaxID=2592817 RepID=UPI0011629A97|nr:class I SAM-dependent methyltransferase [Tardiphaga sp. vice304]QDM28163.1 class I SAM-dependent methyltransferase [Tardiphaga sp. vice304]